MSRELIGAVYSVSATFPSTERYGLTSQIRRAANSIGANLAEACGRPTDRDRAQFFGYAIASADEVEHHLTIAGDVGLIAQPTCRDLIGLVDEIRVMTKSLRRRCLRSGI